MLPRDSRGQDSPQVRTTPAARAPTRTEFFTRVLLLLVVPLLLIGPALLPGRRFLPQLPSGFAPLSDEAPDSAQAAWRQANYLTGDRLFPCLTDQVELRARLLQGESPAWEPRLALGMPLYATAITGTLYPPNLLALVLEPDIAAAPLALLSLFLAGLGLWLFLERRGLCPGACAVGAVCLQGAAYAIGNLHYPMKVDAALWLPWSLWSIEGLALRQRRSAAWLALSQAFSFLAGFPPVAIFCAAAAALYGLLRLTPLAELAGLAEEPPPRRQWLKLAALLPLALGAASVQLAPMYSASRESLRQERSAEDLEHESLPPAAALGLVVPDLFGSPLEPALAPQLPAAWWLTARDDWERAQGANALEWNTSMGVACALLALTAVVARFEAALVPLLLALLSLGFAQAWPGLALLYRVPGFDLGAPSRALCVAWVALPWMAALGAEALLRGEGRARPCLVAASAILALLALAAWLVLEPPAFVPHMEQVLAERHQLSIAEVQSVVPPAQAERAAAELRRSLAAVLAACLCLCLAPALIRTPSPAISPGASSRSARPRVSVPSWLCALILPCMCAALAALGAEARTGWLAPRRVLASSLAGAFALIWASSRSGRSALEPAYPLLCTALCELALVAPAQLVPRELPAAGLFPPSAGIDAIEQAAGRDGRVWRFDASPSGVEDVLRLARPNLLHAYGLCELTPYVAFTPRPFVELFERLDPRTRFRSGIARLPDLALLDHPLLDLVRVRCLLSTRPISHPRLRPMLEREGFHVYRRSGSMPVARMLPRATPVETQSALALLARGGPELEQQLYLPPEERGGDRSGPDWRAGELSVRRPTPGSLDVEIKSSSGGFLLLGEQWYPGWKAWIGDRPIPTLRANHALRAYEIPPGDCVLHTVYEPRSLIVGALVSCLCFALIGLLFWRGH